MKTFFATICACLLTVAFVGCDVDVKDEGALPKVDVEGGRVPDVDVTGPDVEVEPKKETMTVPDVDISTEEKEVTVPDINVDIPDENDQ